MTLDPRQFPFAKLVDAKHRLPWGLRMFGDNAEHPGFERVDLNDQTTHMLIAGGSIALADAPATPPAPPDATPAPAPIAHA